MVYEVLITGPTRGRELVLSEDGDWSDLLGEEVFRAVRYLEDGEVATIQVKVAQEHPYTTV